MKLFIGPSQLGVAWKVSVNDERALIFIAGSQKNWQQCVTKFFNLTYVIEYIAVINFIWVICESQTNKENYSNNFGFE